MALSSLADRLKGLPIVLAGPILRRVASQTAIVWVALREAALTVYDTGGTQPGQILPTSPATTQRATTPIGQNLHMVALTARGPDGTLKENAIYPYDLTYIGANNCANKKDPAVPVTPELARTSHRRGHI